MAFKSLYLRRTKILYPQAGSSRSLSSLLNSITLTEDALTDIIELENESFTKREFGAFADELEQLFKLAKKEINLDAMTLKNIYFHLLRRDELPANLTKNDLPTLIDAYAEINENLPLAYPTVYFSRLKGLLFFGYIESFNLHEKQPSLADIKQRKKIWSQCSKYTSIPGMLDKAERFQSFSEQPNTAERLLKLLQKIDYQHQPFNPEYPLAYDTTSLSFWGLVFIILLSNDHGKQLLADFASLDNMLPLYREHLEILTRFVTATKNEALIKQFKTQMGHLVTRV